MPYNKNSLNLNIYYGYCMYKVQAVDMGNYSIKPPIRDFHPPGSSGTIQKGNDPAASQRKCPKRVIGPTQLLADGIGCSIRHGIEPFLAG
jgi:hypothetical protein